MICQVTTPLSKFGVVIDDSNGRILRAPPWFYLRKLRTVEQLKEYCSKHKYALDELVPTTPAELAHAATLDPRYYAIQKEISRQQDEQKEIEEKAKP